MDDFLDRHDRMARLKQPTGLNTPDNFEIRDSNPIASVFLILIGMVMGMVLLSGLRACDPPPATAKVAECANCHNKTMTMANWFRKKNNPHPVKMANAVLATNHPRLLAAVAVAGEKNTPYTVRKGGYKKRHAGAFQVNEKLHGAVPYGPTEQAAQAEKILERLMTSYPTKKALSIYGGDSTDAYQKRVLAALQEVPK